MYGRKSTYALSKKAQDIIAHRALSSFSISLSCVGNNFENFRQKCAKADLPIGIVAKGVKTPLPAVREGGETLGADTIPKEDRQASI